MAKIYLVLLSLGIFVLSGCNVEDTKAAQTDKIDFDFIKGNCAPVISHYESLQASGVVLNDLQNYQYSNCLLSDTGFDILNGLDSVITNGSSDIYTTMSSLLGTSSLNQQKVSELTSQYDKVIASCNSAPKDANGKIIDQNMLTLCGLAATSNTILEISGMIMDTPGGPTDIVLSEQGMSDALSNVTTENLQSGVETYVANNGGDQYLTQLGEDMTYMENASAEIGTKLGDSNFSNTINDFTNNVKPNGSVTTESLINYINSLNKGSNSGGTGTGTDAGTNTDTVTGTGTDTGVENTDTALVNDGSEPVFSIAF